jgi:hypothetical protein
MSPLFLVLSPLFPSVTTEIYAELDRLRAIKVREKIG